MVTRRHDDQAAIAVGVRPGPRFIGVADGIEGFIAKVDAAGVEFVFKARETLDLFPADLAIDA